MLAPLAANAQWNFRPTPNDTLHSVQVLPDGKVAVRIYAPEAKTVSMGGDVWARAPFVKAENGVWETILEGVAPGTYRYHFVVDGVKTYDPKGPLASETTAIMTVAPQGDEFFMMKNVPHGAVAERYYWSETLGQMRRLHVWTPAGYEAGKAKLPVLYLIHGGGDSDVSWSTAGCAGDILDNLMADGKMEPMIVVMPNGACDISMFEKDLMNDVIPYIESNY